ncbi:hypothetical protein [Pantoea sp.]|uniref:hypothetical protein n=1 Tax=Pantoea sp. TaxID=69393 RepID=UPI0028A9DF3A|nr:hypothetical protein [Pantoea sp.]
MHKDNDRHMLVSDAIHKAVRQLINSGHEVTRKATISTLEKLRQNEKEPYLSDIYRDASLMVRNGKI